MASLCEDAVEKTALFPCHDEVDEELVEAFRVIPQCVGEACAPFDLLLDLPDDTPEVDVFYLIRKDLQGLDKRQPRRDHRGKLPCEEQYLDVLIFFWGLYFCFPVSFVSCMEVRMTPSFLSAARSASPDAAFETPLRVSPDEVLPSH
jgi:hypothetical protein